MKKLVSVLVIAAALSIVAIYVFIPSTLKVSKSITIPSNARNALQYLSSSAYWKKWFNSNNSINDLVYQGSQFIPDSVIYSEVSIKILHNGISSYSKMKVVPLTDDSIILVWSAELAGGNSPFSRMRQYNNAVHLKESFTAILNRYKEWFSNNANVYGSPVVRGQIQDSVLVSTRAIFNKYPTDTMVYALFQKLRDHYSKYGAEQTGYPMLSVMYGADGNYKTQVAIPISKEVVETKDILMKHMFKGKALTIDVKGGYTSIEKGLQALEQYKSDYEMISPAIVFQSLITNRMSEKDTTKWITKLYYPVY